MTDEILNKNYFDIQTIYGYGTAIYHWWLNYNIRFNSAKCFMKEG